MGMGGDHMSSHISPIIQPIIKPLPQIKNKKLSEDLRQSQAYASSTGGTILTSSLGTGDNGGSQSTLLGT